MDDPISFHSSIWVPIFSICFFVSGIPVLVDAEPTSSGLYVFQFLSQPEMKPVRIFLSIGALWFVMIFAAHLIRRLFGQAMLEIWPDKIVFQGVFRREVPINQIVRVDDEYGSMLIRLKHGRPVRIPVIGLKDFYGAKRALERVNEQITSRSAT